MLVVDILILGSGWTSQFLIPLLEKEKVSFAATSRDGGERYGKPTIKFEFDPLSDDEQPFTVLPDARTVVITFPIYKSGASKRLVTLFGASHAGTQAAYIQLGSSGIWNKGPTVQGGTRDQTWSDRNSPFDTTNDRAKAEIELLSLSPGVPTTVLNLCGLWGGQRNMRNWVGRVAPTKEVLAEKTSIHMIHGYDVARAILAVHQDFLKAVGQRWLLTDGRIYDWWDLASAWGSGGEAASDTDPQGPHAQWVRELMEERGVRALPRPPERLGRLLDSREFWSTFGLSPAKARLERGDA